MIKLLLLLVSGLCLNVRVEGLSLTNKQQIEPKITQRQITICPQNWFVSNFVCQFDWQCNMNGGQGVCRQQRCCLQSNQQTQNCLQTERNTGQQCLNDNHCSYGVIWARSTCRNGFCCESANNVINQPAPVCEQGVAIAATCTHDTQCWQYANQPNQLSICQNGHCCVETCQNGGKPTGRKCSSNASDCIYVRNNQYLLGRCDQGVCCSNPNYFY